MSYMKAELFLANILHNTVTVVSIHKTALKYFSRK